MPEKISIEFYSDDNIVHNCANIEIVRQDKINKYLIFIIKRLNNIIAIIFIYYLQNKKKNPKKKKKKKNVSNSNLIVILLSDFH